MFLHVVAHGPDSEPLVYMYTRTPNILRVFVCAPLSTPRATSSRHPSVGWCPGPPRLMRVHCVARYHRHLRGILEMRNNGSIYYKAASARSFQLCMQSKSFYYPVFDLFHCLNCISEPASSPPPPPHNPFQKQILAKLRNVTNVTRQVRNY